MSLKEKIVDFDHFIYIIMNFNDNRIKKIPVYAIEKGKGEIVKKIFFYSEGEFSINKIECSSKYFYCTDKVTCILSLYKK